MKKHIIILCAFLYVIACSTVATAGQLKVFIAEFGVSGVQNKEEIKGTLPALLASRMNNDSILVVDQAAGADVTVTGTYVVLGKTFSLDAAARDGAGKVLTRAFEQGVSQDELIPAMNKLAQKLAAAITKPTPPSSSAPNKTAVPIPEPAAITSPDLIRPPTQVKASQPGWVSQRIEGELSGIAPGKSLENGEREIFVTSTQGLRLYRMMGQTMKLLDQKSFPAGTKILSVETADLDGSGTPEAFLTIMIGDRLASQVWLAKDNALSKVADNLPYYFRALAPAGGSPKMYAQQIGIDEDFYGNVYELEKHGSSYEAVRPFKLPRFGNLFNFNRFKDPDGKENFVLLNEDGYILIYSSTGEELWRSNDKFGGSQLYFQREAPNNLRITGEKYRWVFLQQRINITKDGDIIIPKNSGMFVIGNNRSYSKSSVFAFSWNGSLLEEKWHTPLMESYLADYFFDQQQKELVLLQIVSSEGVFSKGASMIAVKKVE